MSLLGVSVAVAYLSQRSHGPGYSGPSSKFRILTLQNIKLRCNIPIVPSDCTTWLHQNDAFICPRGFSSRAIILHLRLLLLRTLLHLHLSSRSLYIFYSTAREGPANITVGMVSSHAGYSGIRERIDTPNTDGQAWASWHMGYAT